MQGIFSSIEGVCEQLKKHRYITDQSLATVVYLSYHLHKPIFLEGEPGVGKTEVALVLSELLDAKLIRLQCYEGLDANSALYDQFLFILYFLFFLLFQSIQNLFGSYRKLHEVNTDGIIDGVHNSRCRG